MSCVRRSSQFPIRVILEMDMGLLAYRPCPYKIYLSYDEHCTIRDATCGRRVMRDIYRVVPIFVFGGGGPPCVCGGTSSREGFGRLSTLGINLAVEAIEGFQKKKHSCVEGSIKEFFEE